MKNVCVLSIVAALVLLLGLSVPQSANGETAQSVFNSTFGQQLKQVRSTRDTADDVDLATTMLNAAKSSLDNTELAVLICENTVALASRHPSGYSVAVEALDLIATLQPENAGKLQLQAANLLEKQFRSAKTDEAKEESGQAFIDAAVRFAESDVDAKSYRSASLLYRRASVVARMLKWSEEEAGLKAQAEQYMGQARIQSQIDTLLGQLKTKPENAGTNAKLVRLYTFELDDPTSASAYLEHCGDDELKSKVLTAAQQIEGVDAKTALDMGEWYEKESKSVSKPGKILSLTRARAYFAHAEATFDSVELSKTKAQISLKRVDGQLKLLQPVAVASTRTANSRSSKKNVIDLLKKIDTTKDRIAGQWQFQRGRLSGQSSGGFGGFGGFAAVRPPVEVDGNYELEMILTRTQGDGPVFIIMPVGSEKTVSFTMGQRDFSGFGRNQDNNDNQPQGGRRSAIRRFQQQRENFQNSTVSGLYNIDEKGATENGTAVKGSLTNSRAYAIAIKLESDEDDAETTISIYLNKKPFIKWKGRTAGLSSPGMVRFAGAKEKTITVATSGRSSISISRMLLKMTKGEAEEMGSDRAALASNDNNNNNPNPGNDPQMRERIMQRLRDAGLSDAEIQRRIQQFEQMRRRRD